MSRYSPERRSFLKGAGTIGLAGLATLSGLIVIGGCGKDEEAARTAADAATEKTAPGQDAGPCNDLSGLTQSQIENREVYDYVPTSEYPDELCSNCEYWEPGDEGQKCGGCSLMAGPIHPDGWCSAWSEMG